MSGSTTRKPLRVGLGRYVSNNVVIIQPWNVGLQDQWLTTVLKRTKVLENKSVKVPRKACVYSWGLLYIVDVPTYLLAYLASIVIR